MKKILLGLVILSLFATNAFAATTVTILKRENWGASRITYGYVTISATTYTTGGIALTARSIGLDNVKVFTISDSNTPVYEYQYDYTNGKLKIYFRKTSASAPAASPATTDYFTVVDDNSAATNGKLLAVCTNGTGAGPNAYFGYVDGTGVTSAATIAYSRFSAADAATTIAPLDTVNCALMLRANLVNGDTLFFDDDATNAYDRLMYSGTGLGNMGDLYVTFGNGNLLKIAKKTNSQITVAAALPLYFDEDATINLKLLSVTDGDANSTFSADPTYTSLPYFNNAALEYTTATAVTATVYFIAVGN